MTLAATTAAAVADPLSGALMEYAMRPSAIATASVATVTTASSRLARAAGMAQPAAQATPQPQGWRALEPLPDCEEAEAAAAEEEADAAPGAAFGVGVASCAPSRGWHVTATATTAAAAAPARFSAAAAARGTAGRDPAAAAAGAAATASVASGAHTTDDDASAAATAGTPRSPRHSDAASPALGQRAALDDTDSEVAREFASDSDSQSARSLVTPARSPDWVAARRAVTPPPGFSAALSVSSRSPDVFAEMEGEEEPVLPAASAPRDARR